MVVYSQNVQQRCTLLDSLSLRLHITGNVRVSVMSPGQMPIFDGKPLRVTVGLVVRDTKLLNAQPHLADRPTE